ncbi:MAG: hypothetical protein L6Q37_08615 [Bdellovibrionaceae bacterium]|nr:hypothetical protein [Pseudobdellovibrionaceae bacterium]NUM58064.1 hypothetical protein [Pseudobdellovibrionaceae bacterium]
MKKILLTLITMAGLNAHSASGFDQMYQTVTCSIAENIPDMMVSLKVFEGGFAGVPQLQVINYNWGRPTSMQNYFTKKTYVTSINGDKLVTFTGKDIRLIINTSRYAPKQGFQSELILSHRSNNWTRKFKCDFLSHVQVKN